MKKQRTGIGPEWVYGITTVPERRETLLPRTINSLARAGFTEPRIFVDGVESAEAYLSLNLPVTTRFPRVYIHANWVLSIYELYLRNPDADLYALFQDDVIAPRNLKRYLGHCEYVPGTYWNLYTFPQNQALSTGATGFYPSNQYGKGALGLVFNREALVELLTARHILERAQQIQEGWPFARGLRNIDGGIISALSKAGYMEMVHNPSLLQHTGKGREVSTLGIHDHPLAPSFPGEDFDCLTLLENPCNSAMP